MKNDVELNIRLRIAIVKEWTKTFTEKKSANTKFAKMNILKKKQKREKETEETTHTKQASNKRIEFWT